LAVLLGLIALLFAASDECWVLGTETTIAADHYTATRFERVENAILVDPPSPGIRSGAPCPLRVRRF
jgi:hypothetical protein